MRDLSPRALIDAAYDEFGLNTPEPIRASRLQAAESLAGELKPKAALPIVRCAFGVPSRDTISIDDAILDADPDFTAADGDRERRAVASAALATMLRSRKQEANDLSLVVVAAALGGLRVLDFQRPLISRARARLFEAQSFEALNLDVVLKKPSVPAEQITAIESAASTNNFSVAAPTLLKVMGDSVEYTHAATQGLRGQVQKVADALNKLQEQVSVHWWVMGKRSSDKAVAFSSLTAMEAAALAAVDLAALTSSSHWGLFPSRQLLSEVLSEHEVDAPQRVGNVTGIGAIDWRLSLIQDTSQTIAPTVAPLTYAAWLAAESSDESDWIRRYERSTGVQTSTQLSMLDVAQQLYIERIALARSYAW